MFNIGSVVGFFCFHLVITRNNIKLFVIARQSRYLRQSFGVRANTIATDEMITPKFYDATRNRIVRLSGDNLEPLTRNNSIATRLYDVSTTPRPVLFHIRVFRSCFRN